MADLEKTQQLLKDVKRVIKHHNDIAILKGEDFNIFSILKIETKENKTHSAFLAELLNPKGKHHFGSKFLELFLKEIKHQKNVEIQEKNSFNFNTELKEFRVEKTIPSIPNKCSSGRIDIYLKDCDDNIICIENKIYAGDQYAQLLRYYNHNKDKNTVYYLTLFNKEPDKNSITCNIKKHNNCLGFEKLKEEENYFNITYKNHIIPWLELCLKEATEKPILRETIKQYIILIKKLTHTLNMEENVRLNKVIFDNFEEAKYIADNFYSNIYNIQKYFKEDVLQKLKEHYKTSEYYDVEDGNDIKKHYSQIWIKLKKFSKGNQFYGIETFNGNRKGNDNGNLFIGIHSINADITFKPITDMETLGKWWPTTKTLLDKNQKVINLKNQQILNQILIRKSDEYNDLVNCVVKQCNIFIKDTEKYLFEHLNNK